MTTRKKESKNYTTKLESYVSLAKNGFNNLFG